MLTYQIEQEVRSCPSSPLNTVYTRKRRDAAANLFAESAYYLIKCMSWLDTEAGKLAMERANRIADSIAANPVAPGRAVSFEWTCGDYRLRYLASNL